ncbi:PREDICTED: LOW QUALITY PROTEIN: peroxidase 4-like [Nicotiana attenuata]|uniref:LOW QUALITY PROTEIN: peroxidase 4-like n=1 Tax=Nicotiana attenuata TaxID=49451 RepID=UPI000904E4E9|nr:PREDICTED: LOW QUALITY PROTEIN: peroxidase 4-like [Nicotiana attenuata]
MVTGPPSGPVVDTVMIDNDEKSSDEGASLYRRRRSSSSQQDARPIKTVTRIEDDASALWGEFDLVDTANSHFRAPIVFSATATSSPPVAPDHEEGVPIPQYPVHGNLGQNYVAPSEDPQRRRNVTLSVSTGCNLLSRPVELANYMKPLASLKDWEKIQALSGECLLNNAIHNAAVANFLASEGLQRLIRKKEELTSVWVKLLVERDQAVIRLSELETRAAEAVVLETRLQQSEQEVVGGPSWTVKLGRRDSTIASKTLAETDLPGPFDPLNRLISSFASKGLSTRDMVALSGAHTIGQAQCFLFRDRIYGNGTDIDAGFASTRRRQCPQEGENGNLAPLDFVTPNQFDNNYFKNLIQKKGLLQSHQVLFNGGSTDNIVSEYSNSARAFSSDFAAAMIKMGDISPLTGQNGIIRKVCGSVN